MMAEQAFGWFGAFRQAVHVAPVLESEGSKDRSKMNTAENEAANNKSHNLAMQNSPAMPLFRRRNPR
jgi:hypothetical protein